MSKPSANPFFETDFSKFMDMSKMMDMSKWQEMFKMMDMSKVMDMSKWTDMSKMMGDYKMPGFDWEAMMSTFHKNAETIMSSNQLAYENFQSFMRRQTELMRQNMEAAGSMMQAVISAQTPEEKVAKQAEAAKITIDRCMAGIKEMTEMMTQNQYQTMETMSNRVYEGLNELQGLMRSARAA